MTTGDRPKIAMYWCSSCGGCEESVLDLAEDLLDLSAAVDVVFWPFAMDYKRKDVEALDPGAIDLCLINGAIRSDAHVKMVRLLREKSRTVIAHGACAHLGGVVGLANFFDLREILVHTYRELPTVENPTGVLPGDGEPGHDLPRLLAGVTPLNQVIPVDGTIPGCPPPPELTRSALKTLLEGPLPPHGRVWGAAAALCQSCARRSSMPEGAILKRFKRLHETQWDAGRCFLAQGLVCLGPVTRGGCEGQCIAANMPCRGCFGPPDSVRDQGAKAVSLLAALIDADDADQIREATESLADPAGLCYRYALPSSFLRGKTGD